ncbi:MAG: glycoside hydrolase family protein [Caldilineaceae bacterium]|nr:glycoside hydrolase family protein [Caldilineaceae bacterium]
MQQSIRRLLILLLVGLGLTSWLHARPAAPARILAGLEAIPCTAHVSNAPETLVPSGEAQMPAKQTPPSGLFELTPEELALPHSLRWRIGVGIPDGNPHVFDWMSPRPGWYLNWSTNPFTTSPAEAAALGMEFTPMLRLGKDGLHPGLAAIYRQAQAQPGMVWLVGNEPDVRWQDDATPAEYACQYYRAWRTIKLADPSAQVAIGGISQVTPLRLRYLDAVLASYQQQFGASMPVDIWNIHAFVLREQAGEWGVDLPPGFADATDGLAWDVEDHDDLGLVEEQVRRMRLWMAERGERAKPLYITEYGILIPEEFGFTPSRVINFMIGSFDLLDSLTDESLGYPLDGNRLVQRWLWFSTRYYLYPSGDLFTTDGEPLPPLRALSGYLRAHAK